MKKNLFYLMLLLINSFSLLAQDQNDLSLLQLGQQYERSGEIEQAEKIYQRLYNKNPNYFDFYDSYRKILEYSKKYDEAIKIITNWLQTNPNDFNQIVNFAIIKFRIGEENEGRNKLQDAIKIAQNNINVYRVIALTLIEARYYDEALRIYLQARNIDKNAFIIEIADLYIFREKYEEAMEEYLKLLSFDNNQFGYVQSLMMRHIDNKKFLNTALQVTLKKLEKNKENISFYYLLSWLYNEQKNYNESFNTLLEIEKRKKSNGYEIYNFAENAFREKAYEIAIKAYQYITINFKNSGVYLLARFGYAKATEDMLSSFYIDSTAAYNSNTSINPEVIKRYKEVISIYEDFKKEFPNTQYSAEVEFRIGKIKFRKCLDFDGAINSFNFVLKKYYSNFWAVNSLIELADISFLRNNLKDVNLKYSEVLQHPNAQNDQKEFAQYKIAELLYFEGKFDSSLKILSEISNNLSSDYANDALLLSNFIQNNLKNNLLISFSNAEKLEKQKKYPEALEIYYSIINNDNSLVDDTYIKICNIQRLMRLYSESIKTAQKFINTFPESALIDKMLFICAEIYEKDLKDNNNAIKYYEKILVEYPNSIYINEVRKRIRFLKGDTNF